MKKPMYCWLDKAKIKETKTLAYEHLNNNEHKERRNIIRTFDRFVEENILKA